MSRAMRDQTGARLVVVLEPQALEAGENRMNLEHHQLELRYERLRVRRPDRERRLLSSMSEHGQQAPIVVVAGSSDGSYVVIDGHKRIRAAHPISR